MFTHILIPTDFSPAAWKAFEVGLKISDTYNARISLLHIYPMSSRFIRSSTKEDMTPKLDQVKENMARISRELADERVPSIEHVVVSGNVEEQLLTFVGKNEFDLIIMGVNSNGQDNAPGSHTFKMMEKTAVPVLVVPNNFPV